MSLTRTQKSPYEAPRQAVVVQDELSPSRKFVLQTNHVWEPAQKTIPSPSRGLRTPDMREPTASMLHSGNAHLFSNISAPLQVNNCSVLTLSEQADLTLNHIESGFAPQKMCTQLKKIGVLVPIEEERKRDIGSMTLHERLTCSELPRTLPRSHLKPFASECLHFYPFSTRTIEKQRTDVETDSLYRSLVTASISNFRFADHMPSAIPGTDLVMLDKPTGMKRVDAINSWEITRNLEKEIVARKIEDNHVFSRLDAFESRENHAAKRSAEIITVLCVNCGDLREESLERLDAVVMESLKEDELVSEREENMKLKLEAGERILNQQGLYFDEEVDDVCVRIVISLIQSDIVSRLKMLLLGCNCVTQTRAFTWLLRSAVLIELTGPQVRDSFYQFFCELAQQNLAVFYANKKAYYSPSVCISLSVVCRLNYVVCTEVMGLAVSKLDSILKTLDGEDDLVNGSQSVMRTLLQNSLAKNTQFTQEHDKLTISVQCEQQDENIMAQCDKLLVKEWSTADEICHTVLLICNAAFGILESILMQQEQLRRRQRASKQDHETGHENIKEFEDVLQRVFELLDDASLKCPKEAVYRYSETDEFMLSMLHAVEKGQLCLGEPLVTLRFECSQAWLGLVKDALTELFSE